MKPPSCVIHYYNNSVHTMLLIEYFLSYFIIRQKSSWDSRYFLVFRLITEKPTPYILMKLTNLLITSNQNILAFDRPLLKVDVSLCTEKKWQFQGCVIIVEENCIVNCSSQHWRSWSKTLFLLQMAPLSCSS